MVTKMIKVNDIYEYKRYLILRDHIGGVGPIFFTVTLLNFEGDKSVLIITGCCEERDATVEKIEKKVTTHLRENSFNDEQIDIEIAIVSISYIDTR